MNLQSARLLVPVIRTACEYYEAEADGHLHVLLGNRVQCFAWQQRDRHQDKLYSKCVYGCVEGHPSCAGWLPCKILFDLQTEYERRNASVI